MTENTITLYQFLNSNLGKEFLSLADNYVEELGKKPSSEKGLEFAVARGGVAVLKYSCANAKNDDSAYVNFDLSEEICELVPEDIFEMFKDWVSEDSSIAVLTEENVGLTEVVMNMFWGYAVD